MAKPVCVQCGRESRSPLMDVSYVSVVRKPGRRCPACVEANWRADMVQPLPVKSGK